MRDEKRETILLFTLYSLLFTLYSLLTPNTIISILWLLSSGEDEGDLTNLDSDIKLY